MANLSQVEVEEWLDSHPEVTSEYFLKKVELPTINSWLVLHGFPTINDCMSSSGRNSGSPENIPAAATAALPTEEAASTSQSNPSIQPLPKADNRGRSNSKKCLRHDFAKAKSKPMFRTHDIPGHDASTAASRRNSLKEMRKYSSLPPNSMNMLSLLIESKVKLPQSLPIHNRTTKRNLLHSQGEREFFLNVVREIATELDLKALSHKTVDNIAVLLDSDGASLFLIDGPRGGRKTLVSKVFDVHSGASAFLLPAGKDRGNDNEVQLPWGVGILGHVAETGQTVNLQVACEDPRFDDQVDKIMGYHTETLLCMPVKNAYDEIIGVAQVVNKNPDLDDGYFTDKDENLFGTYLQFVGIAITNAQVMETSRQEYDRNRNLLEIVHDIFEEQTSLEKVLLKIMQRGQKLLDCQRAAVLLLDETADAIRFTTAFHILCTENGTVQIESTIKGEPLKSISPYMLAMAEQVVTTGENVNITERHEVDKDSKDDVKNLLAMPIRNASYEIIGVATIINRLNGRLFDENDEQLFEAFTIFCGLGIHNAIMYNELERAMARQKVALEVLSYHATACNKEVQALLEESIPCADDFGLFSLTFDDFSLEPDEMVKGAIAMFLQLGLVKNFAIEKATLYRFLITVKRNYRDVPYHNWRHAFNVSQVMFAILMRCDMRTVFTDLEILGMFVGCLCHDLDHRGTNNAFQQKTGSALVLLYGRSNTMEHHHFNQAVMILSSETHNIFASLSPENYCKVMAILKQSILATDLCVYFEHRAKFFSLIENKTYNWKLDEHRQLLRSMLMTASDLAASCKPWEVQQKVAHLVTTEFFVQGDKEREELKITPQPLMDREREHELPQLQIRWINDICLPLYEALSKMNPKMKVMVEGALENKRQWQILADEAAAKAKEAEGKDSSEAENQKDGNEPEDPKEENESENRKEGNEPEDPKEGNEPEDPKEGNEPEDPKEENEPENSKEGNEPENPKEAKEADEPKEEKEADEPKEEKEADEPKEEKEADEPEDEPDDDFYDELYDEPDDELYDELDDDDDEPDDEDDEPDDEDDEPDDDDEPEDEPEEEEEEPKEEKEDEPKEEKEDEPKEEKEDEPKEEKEDEPKEEKEDEPKEAKEDEPKGEKEDEPKEEKEDEPKEEKEDEPKEEKEDEPKEEKEDEPKEEKEDEPKEEKEDEPKEEKEDEPKEAKEDEPKEAKEDEPKEEKEDKPEESKDEKEPKEPEEPIM